MPKDGARLMVEHQVEQTVWKIRVDSILKPDRAAKVTADEQDEEFIAPKEVAV